MLSILGSLSTSVLWPVHLLLQPRRDGSLSRHNATSALVSAAVYSLESSMIVIYADQDSEKNEQC